MEKIFETNKPLEVQTKKFIKRLNGFINSCFKKVKIETTVDYKLEQLYDKRRYQRSTDDDKSKIALEDVEEELIDRYSERMYHKIRDEIKVINNTEGVITQAIYGN